MDFRDQLARLRVACATGYIPRDLGQWALDVLEQDQPSSDRIRERDALLRSAAATMSGSRWSKARRLQHLILAFRTGRAIGYPDGLTPHGFVSEAYLIDPDLPASMRHLLRLID